jgi:hypothetical protein
MRADLTLITVAALATVFDGFVTTPSEVQPERSRAEPGFHAAAGDGGVRVAQNVGPLATPALNPRLGSQPPGGHLGERATGRADTVPVPGAGTTNPERIAPLNGDRLGPPPVAIPQGAPNAVAPPAAGAVPPPAAGAVQPPPGPNVAPLPAPAPIR